MKTHHIMILLLVLVSACTPKSTITSFEECVAAGNPVMESYPRQCSADGKTFVEELAEEPQPPEEEELEPPAAPVFHECTDAEKQNQACTFDYRPVCGFVDNGIRCITAPCQSVNATTFGNGCSACASQANGYYEGECQQLRFVVCDGNEAKTGFSPEKFAADTGGICVDICPGNFDEYTTQIGVKMCIEHYGEKEISQWETCTKSTESCDCVKAYETTRGEQIEDTKYRCVPEQYGDRLLFSGGKDRLDENGEQSVIIA